MTEVHPGPPPSNYYVEVSKGPWEVQNAEARLTGTQRKCQRDTPRGRAARPLWVPFSLRHVVHS